MNVRQIIRNIITELVTIDREQIENAIMDLDLNDMIANAIEDKLPDAIEKLVQEELNEAVSNALNNLLD